MWSFGGVKNYDALGEEMASLMENVKGGALHVGLPRSAMFLAGDVSQSSGSLLSPPVNLDRYVGTGFKGPTMNSSVRGAQKATIAVALSSVKKWKRLVRAKREIPHKGSNFGAGLLIKKRKTSHAKGSTNSSKKRDNGLRLVDDEEDTEVDILLAEAGSQPRQVL